MFYTNKSIRLHTRCIEYLELINKANRRYEDKRSYLAEYDACKSIFDMPKLITSRSYIIGQMERWQTLSDWLVSRYQTVFTELHIENINRTKNRIKEIDLTLSNEPLNVDL